MILSSPSEFLSIAIGDPTLALDTETTGKDIRSGEGYAVGISGACKYKDEVYTAYFPVAHYEGNVEGVILDDLRILIETRQKLIMHNAKFDLPSLETVGLDIDKFPRWYCTMRMAHMLNENLNGHQYGLDWLARNELKIKGKEQKDFKPIWKMGMGHMIPVAEIEEYAARDTGLTYLLFEKLYPYFVKSGFDGSEV